MPNARRIIFGSYVIPTQSVEAEETSIRHTEFQASPGKALGGNGTATINATQWGDGWTSFAHENAYWEDLGDNWELQGEAWDGTVGMTANPTGQNLTDDGSDLAFLYIKNTGSSINALISLNGQLGAYYIIIPPKGSICLRGDGTNLDCNDVYVITISGTTPIEFIVAKE